MNRRDQAPVGVGYWQDIARQWKQIGPPLRPTEQDTALLSDEIGFWARDNGAPRALILGVTPELYRMPWPNGTDLLGVDYTREMIDMVWPGPRNAVICADWAALPLKAGSRDIALCDGGLHLLAYPQEQRKLVQRLRRVIAPEGLCIFRLYIPPKDRESPDEVLRELLDSKIPDLNQLKIRLWMALHKNTKKGIKLKQVYDAIHHAEPDFNNLASLTGWPAEDLLAINTYRNCPTTYFFLSLDDILHLFCENPGGFMLKRVHVPAYELGECCPTVVFRRIDTPKG